MYILRLSYLYLLAFTCIKSAFALPTSYVIKPYQLEINTLLQIEHPTYITVNDCLHIESQTSWQTMQVMAAKITHWHKFEIKKNNHGLYFLGDICK